MSEPADNAPETAANKSRGLGSYVVWGFVVVMVYVLGSGPFWAIMANGIWKGSGYSPKVSKALSICEENYHPLLWMYQRTPMRKPLGIYWHLWCPAVFDKNGET
jgi:hypothetical protein